jgi:predicted alpha/beta-hydrolase family hydrolase
MAKSSGKDIQFFVNEKAGIVSGLLLQPSGARAFLVFAHGAGAGMRHSFMEEIAIKLADQSVATLRYQFPYMEKHTKRPDSQTVLTDSVRAAVAAAKKHARELPLFAGGKSMGGRMTSLAAAEGLLEGVSGLIFFGFPLHAAGKPGAERGEHLARIPIPMLFLQGSRDALAELKLLKPLCANIGKRAELFVVQGGDHSFHMLKSAHKSDGEVFDELAKKAAGWIEKQVLRDCEKIAKSK